VNKTIPFGIGITIIAIAVFGMSFNSDTESVPQEISQELVTQQDLRTMIDGWMNNPDEDDTNQRLEIMKAYYTFEETGQKLTHEREGLLIMNQIRKMVSLDMPREELDQLRNEVRKELGLEPLFETKILHIDSNLVDCVGVGPQKCMLVRENSDLEWNMFYDSIDGFEYQEGTEYKISVIVTKVENPPADSSFLKYTLVEILDFLSNNCGLEHDPGLCKAYMPKYYFDKMSNSCKEFIWGGCNGVVPFESLSECQIQCNSEN